MASELAKKICDAIAAWNCQHENELRAAIDRVLSAHGITADLVEQHNRANVILGYSEITKGNSVIPPSALKAYIKAEQEAGRWPK